MSFPRYRQDGTTTYCWLLNEDVDVGLPNAAPKDIVSKTSGTPCPVQLAVQLGADRFAKGANVQLAVTATLTSPSNTASSSSSSSSSFAALPSPLLSAAVPPSSLEKSGNITKDATFQMPVAHAAICDWRKCDLFSSVQAAGTLFPSNNFPRNFDDKLARFQSTDLAIPKEGKYTGFAHIVIPMGDKKRADFATFFPVQIGDVAGTLPSSKLLTDGKTTYCWATPKASPFADSVDDTVLTLRTNSNCPGSLAVVVSSRNVQVGDPVSIQWNLQVDPSRDPASLIAEVLPPQAVANPTTGVYSNVPVAVLGACQKNAPNAKCSTYSTAGSTTVEINKVVDTNYTGDGATNYATTTKFNESGEFVVIARVVLPSIDGARVDMAVYTSVSVAAPASSSALIFLYVGLGIGAVVLLLGLSFCLYRKRQLQERFKDGTSTFGSRGPNAFGSVANTHTSNASSRFSKHPGAPRGIPGYGSPRGFADSARQSMPVDGDFGLGSASKFGAYGGYEHEAYTTPSAEIFYEQHDAPLDTSITLEHLGRDTLEDILADESDSRSSCSSIGPDATMRPRPHDDLDDLDDHDNNQHPGQFSFQTDSDAAWEYAPQGHHHHDVAPPLDASDLEVEPRGTIHLALPPGSFPMMEEDRDYPAVMMMRRNTNDSEQHH